MADAKKRTDRWGRPWDMQKQRLYDAEYFTQHSAAWTRIVVGGKKYSTGNIHIDAINEYLDHLTAMAWFQRRWGPWDIEARHKAGGSAYGKQLRDGAGEIMLPVFARDEPVVLHEVAHCLTPRHFASHGPEFAGVYLELIRYRVGKEAYDLVRSKFNEKPRVRYNRTAIG